jgi:hypothetical protein
MCDAVDECVSFALSSNWHAGYYPQLYSDGFDKAQKDSDGWSFFLNTSATPTPPTPPAPPALPDGFLVSRQNLLMHGARFSTEIYTRDAIGSHACSLEALACV